MNLKVVFLVLLIIVTLFPLLIRESRASTPAGTITYAAGTDTITVIGANSSHPAEFLDLYNADVAGGWGQVTMLGSNQFKFECKIKIGNGSSAGITYFTDIDKQIVVGDVFGGAGRWMDLSSYAYVTFGQCSDTTNKYTSHGCSFIVPSLSSWGFLMLQNSYSNAYLYLYSCDFKTNSGSDCNIQYADRYWNCHFSYYIGVLAASYTSMSGCIMDTSGSLNVVGDAAIDGVTITKPLIYLRFGGSCTVNRVVGRGATGWGLLTYAAGITVNLVNCVLDRWNINDGAASWIINRQYSFDLFVLNGALTDFVEDANVTLTHDGTIYGTWLTNSTGQISTQTLTYGFYNQTGGDTMYGGTPWTLTITHPDWQTYTSAFYPYSKIEWSISMQDTTTENNNILLSGLLVGVLCFAGFIVYVKRGN